MFVDYLKNKIVNKTTSSTVVITSSDYLPNVYVFPVEFPTYYSNFLRSSVFKVGKDRLTNFKRS